MSENKMSLKEVLAPANLISISRVAFAIWIVFLLQSDSLSSIRLSVLLMALAGLTDLFDGIVARQAEGATGKKNRYGIVFDPVADKLFAIILMIAMVVHGLFPVWLAVLVFSRDLVIMIAGSVLVRKYQLVLPSNLPGKYYFVSLAFLLAAYICRFESAVKFLEVLTVALWILSSVYYVRVLKTALASKGDGEVEAGVKQGVEESYSRGAVRARGVGIGVFFLTLAWLFVRDNPLQLW